MKFREIKNIEQFAHLQDEPEFIFKQEGDTTTIFYAVAFPETFGDVEVDEWDAMLRRECRGIVFDSKGNVISRPYHKFFNLNEREETQESKIDISKSHIFMDKLDGSMVRAVKCNGELRLFTKAGLSEVALEAEELAFTQDIKELVNTVGSDKTVIFEYVGSPNYPIVLRYDKPELIITAIRDNNTGEYISWSDVKQIASEFGISCCKTIDLLTLTEAKGSTAELEGTEGYVMRFTNGEMLKIKTEWYKRRHDIKGKINVPRNLVTLIMNNELDDILPDLHETEKHHVLQMSEMLYKNIYKFEDLLIDEYMDSKEHSVDRGEFARYVMANYKGHSNLLFKVYNGDDLTEILLFDILKSCNKNVNFEKYEFLIKE